MMKLLTKAAGWLLAFAGGVLFFWMLPMKLIARWAARQGKSAPCPASLSWLLRPSWRMGYMSPTLDRIGILPGERVLELGPGPGMFTPAAAARVGATGRLVPVDIQPAMIAQLKETLRLQGVAQVEPLVGSAHSLPLAADSFDRAFLITVLPEIPDQRLALAELKRVLKPDGVLSITEEFSDPDYLFISEVVERLSAAGFHLISKQGGRWVYTANFRNLSGG